jgi:hypothetical protein
MDLAPESDIRQALLDLAKLLAPARYTLPISRIGRTRQTRVCGSPRLPQDSGERWSSA